MALSVRGDEIAMTGFSIFSVTSKAKSSANNNTQKVCNSFINLLYILVWDYRFSYSNLLFYFCSPPQSPFPCQDN